MPTRKLQTQQNRNDDDDDLSLQNDSDPFAAPGHTYSIVVSIVLVVIVCICLPLAYKARRASREEDRRRGGRRGGGGGVEEDYEYYGGGGDDGDTNDARVDDGSASYGRRERRKYARKVLEERRRVVDKALFSERFVVMRPDVMYGAGLTEIEEEGEGSEVEEEDIELCIHKGLEDVAISELETVVMSGSTMDESDNNGKSNDDHDVEAGNIAIHNVNDQEKLKEKQKVESSSVVKGQSSSSPPPSPSFSLNHRRSVGCCPICLVDYVDGDEICRSKNTACSHIFHRRCITEWLLLNDECPCCRAPYIGNIPGGTAMSREARQILREVARDRRQNNSRSGRRRNRRSRISSSALSQEQNMQDYNNDNGNASSSNNNTVNGQPSHNFRPLTVTTQSSRLRQPRES